MNHKKEELRELIRELYNQEIGGKRLNMNEIGRHFKVVDLNGKVMVRQHVYYYLQDSTND